MANHPKRPPLALQTVDDTGGVLKPEHVDSVVAAATESTRAEDAQVLRDGVEAIRRLVRCRGLRIATGRARDRGGVPGVPRRRGTLPFGPEHRPRGDPVPPRGGRARSDRLGRGQAGHARPPAARGRHGAEASHGDPGQRPCRHPGSKLGLPAALGADRTHGVGGRRLKGEV